MNYQVTEVASRKDLRDFIALPYRLYRRNSNYVPPLRSQMQDLISGKDNMLLEFGPHAKLLVRNGRRTVGRIMVGFDPAYNRQNGYESAWFSLFECEEDEEAAAALFRFTEDWARRQGADYLRGPEPADNVDYFKGILVMGFDGPPAVMNTYNPPWYNEFLTRWGFEKLRDLFAYTFTLGQIVETNNEKVIGYAMNRYGYHVDHLDLDNLQRDLKDMHEILLSTFSDDDEDAMTVPSLADIDKMAHAMLPVADPDIICIARTNGDNKPIGFVVALPDYNQVFRHIRSGRLFPFGFIKFLYYRRQIDAVRVFMQFVVPAFQRKAVNNAIFYEMCRSAAAKGYRIGDGSSIGETNVQSRQSVERLGGRHYRTYRIYKKKIRAN